MRLIDANKLKERLDELHWTVENGFDKRIYLDDIIDNAPTVCDLPDSIDCVEDVDDCIDEIYGIIRQIYGGQP